MTWLYSRNDLASGGSHNIKGNAISLQNGRPIEVSRAVEPFTIVQKSGIHLQAILKEPYKLVWLAGKRQRSRLLDRYIWNCRFFDIQLRRYCWLRRFGI